MFDPKYIDVVDRITKRSEAAGVTELEDNALTFMSLMCLSERIDFDKLEAAETFEFISDMAYVRDAFNHKTGTLEGDHRLYAEREA